jgi:hypothetical protein
MIRLGRNMRGPAMRCGPNARAAASQNYLSRQSSAASLWAPAGPVSFPSHGKQLVTLAVGDVLMTFSLDGE